MHSVDDMGFNWRSIAFVFYNAAKKMAFAIYFIAFVSTDSEGKPIEDIPIEVWLSPLVYEQSYLKCSKPHLYMLHDWWHGLSYGIDYNGVAYAWYPALCFRHTNGDGVNTNCGVSAHLESADHFDQKSRILHINMNPSTEPIASKGGFSSLGVWEPESLAIDWTNHPPLKVANVLQPPMLSAITQPSVAIEDGFGGLEVVPSPPIINPSLRYQARPFIPQILTKLVILLAQMKDPLFFFKSTSIRLLRRFELRSPAIGLRALQKLFRRNESLPFFTSNSNPPFTHRGLE